MLFNINEKVRVKLTDIGRAIHAENHRRVMGDEDHRIAYSPPKEDSDGWSDWQMWHLMSLYGEHIHLGSKNCFETTIDIVTPNADVSSGGQD